LIGMTRLALTLTIVGLLLVPGQAQQTSTLRIRIVLRDAAGAAHPVPRHALLISDNPSSAPPRQTVTDRDGVAELHVRPGTYTVESDQPLLYRGKSYDWTQMVTVAAGRDAEIELNETNATVTEAASGAAGASEVLMEWQDSVVAIWSETSHGSGFLIDRNGLIATNRRVVGNAGTAEVEVTPTVKIPARVVASDEAAKVAILWVDPGAVASMKPMRLQSTPLVKDQQVFAIGVPLLQEKAMTAGTVSSVKPHAISSSVEVPRESSGGPLLTVDGEVAAITVSDANDAATAVPIEDAKAAIAAAQKKIATGAPPEAAPLPVEPVRRLSPDALKSIVQKRAGSLSAYQMSSEDFEISFVTPVMLYGRQYEAEQLRSRHEEGNRTGTVSETLRPLENFENWTDYVNELLPVLMVRVTPKVVEGFWQSLGRNAAQTQGVNLPVLKHPKAGFARLEVYCDANQVRPIHPFKIAHELPGKDDAHPQWLYEGLYVFAPDALGRQCGAVKIVTFSEKDPAQGDARTVDAGVIEQIRRDFEIYRQ
jgi:S1-C subfamily serine protease